MNAHLTAKIVLVPSPPPTPRPADIVERLNALDLPEARAGLDALRLSAAIEVFDQCALARGARLLRSMAADRAAAIYAGMAIDRVADLFRSASGADRDALTPLLDSECAAAIAALLAYPHDSAGSLMTTEYVRACTESGWAIPVSCDSAVFAKRWSEPWDGLVLPGVNIAGKVCAIEAI